MKFRLSSYSARGATVRCSTTFGDHVIPDTNHILQGLTQHFFEHHRRSKYKLGNYDVLLRTA